MGLVYMPGVCRECGCTDERACDGGCSWVEEDLCSRCAEGMEAAGSQLFEPIDDLEDA